MSLSLPRGKGPPAEWDVLLDDDEVDTALASPGGHQPTPTAESQPTAFPVVRVLEGEAPKPPGVVVDDLLVDDVNLWVGFGGAFKSTLALHVAVCVALGRRVFDSLKVRRAGPVLLVSPEDGQAAVRMMLDAIIEGMGLGSADRATLTERLVMVSDDSIVNLSTDTRRLGRNATDVGAVLVELDPLRNLLGGAEENENGVAGICLDGLRRDVCRAAGAAVLLNAHIRKPGREARSETAMTVHDARGASAWTNGARLVLGVSANAGRVTLRALKANRLRTDICHKVSLEIQADPDVATRWLTCRVSNRSAELASGSLTPGVARTTTDKEFAALEVLDDTHEPGAKLSYTAWLKRSGLIDDTFNKVRMRLINAGLAKSEDTGKRTPRGGPVFAYSITDAGRAVLASRRLAA